MGIGVAIAFPPLQRRHDSLFVGTRACQIPLRLEYAGQIISGKERVDVLVPECAPTLLEDCQLLLITGGHVIPRHALSYHRVKWPELKADSDAVRPFIARG